MKAKFASSSMEKKISLEQFLKENIKAKELVLLSRKKYLSDQNDASVFSRLKDYPHTLYLDAFKAQPIVLDKRSDISIKPEFLAKAFLHKDIYNIAKELNNAIFTQDDLNRRNAELSKANSESNVNAVFALPAPKVDIIKRMTKWIVEKKQCPWFISDANVKQLSNFSNDEQLDELNHIYTALLTFDNIRKSHADDAHTDENVFKETFQKIIALLDDDRIPYTTVDLVRALTKATVPNCEDVFSDAVQFSVQRWLQAKRVLEREGAVKAAEVLYRKFFRFDFEDIKFNDLDADFCPIKFLAITRAIAKMKYNDREDNQNRFLDWETIDEIKTYLNEKYKGQTATDLQRIPGRSISTTHNSCTPVTNISPDNTINQLSTLTIEAPMEVCVNQPLINNLSLPNNEVERIEIKISLVLPPRTNNP